jgi:hypothetical protein
MVNGQSLHHQSLGAQGSVKKLESGHYISQSIGQQSSTGNYTKGGYAIIQGFQQSAWDKLIADTVLPSNLDLKVYPNPFVDTVGFYFSGAIEGDMQIMVFETTGRLIVSRMVNLANNGFQIDLSFLSKGVYLAHVGNLDFTTYVKIIKK